MPDFAPPFRMICGTRPLVLKVASVFGEHSARRDAEAAHEARARVGAKFHCEDLANELATKRTT